MVLVLITDDSFGKISRSGSILLLKLFELFLTMNAALELSPGELLW